MAQDARGYADQGARGLDIRAREGMERHCGKGATEHMDGSRAAQRHANLQEQLLNPHQHDLRLPRFGHPSSKYNGGKHKHEHYQKTSREQKTKQKYSRKHTRTKPETIEALTKNPSKSTLPTGMLYERRTQAMA